MQNDNGRLAVGARVLGVVLIAENVYAHPRGKRVVSELRPTGLPQLTAWDFTIIGAISAASGNDTAEALGFSLAG